MRATFVLPPLDRHRSMHHSRCRCAATVGDRRRLPPGGEVGAFDELPTSLPRAEDLRHVGEADVVPERSLMARPGVQDRRASVHEVAGISARRCAARPSVNRRDDCEASALAHHSFRGVLVIQGYDEPGRIGTNRFVLAIGQSDRACASFIAALAMEALHQRTGAERAVRIPDPFVHSSDVDLRRELGVVGFNHGRQVQTS